MSTPIALAREKMQKICDDSGGISQLFRSGSLGHLNSIRHYYNSSSEDAAFSVEPGSTDDLAKIMKVIKEHDVRFAVKGGGHATNPSFSSTTGIQISMLRFNNVSYDGSGLLTVGTGCVFDEIYKEIRPKKINIVGGGPSVGVGGWYMGGGYSLKTNQFGLGIDTLVEVEIVLPNGDVKTATKTSNPRLFWAIKGGGNNFGIATKFVLGTHPQGTNGNGKVYGGYLAFDKPRVKHVRKAVTAFMSKTDPKSAIVAAFRVYRNHGINEFRFTVLAFYDDEKPNPDPFQHFLDIPHHGQLEESSYVKMNEAVTLHYEYIPADSAIDSLFPPGAHLSEIAGTGVNGPIASSFPLSEIAGIGVTNLRGRWGNVMVSKYTQNLIDVVEEEVEAAKQLMEKHNGRMVVGEIWPFLSTMFDRSIDSAWPHMKGKPNGPLIVIFTWDGKENDDVWIKQMKIALKEIRKVALSDGCTTSDMPVYCNNALDVTTPREIYRTNLFPLSLLRIIYDPRDVMGRTGGFRIPLDVVGSYRITNANGCAIGAPQRPGPFCKVDGDGDTFQISLAPTDGVAYMISIKSTGATYCATMDGDKVCCGNECDAWSIIPKLGTNNQLECSIVNQAATKCWVLRTNEVECITVEDRLEALWRFHPVL